jgi:RNA polymerase sigma factor (TIGR02999 family)
LGGILSKRVPAGDIVPIEFTELLHRADQADPAATDELFALLYNELHRLAERHLRRSGGGLSLGTTTLVHDAYMSMIGRTDTAFPDRSRFFAYASRAMRGLVIDYARRRRAKKRGREFEITLVENVAPHSGAAEPEKTLEALSDALDELAGLDPSLAELVDLHFFAGFTFIEIAELRRISERTVQRDWQKARLLLHRALSDEAGLGSRL